MGNTLKIVVKPPTPSKHLDRDLEPDRSPARKTSQYRWRRGSGLRMRHCVCRCQMEVLIYRWAEIRRLRLGVRLRLGLGLRLVRANP